MNIDEMLEKTNTKKNELVDNGEIVTNFNEFDLESNYMIKFKCEEPLKALTKRNREVEFKMNEIYPIRKIEYNYTSNSMSIEFVLDSIISENSKLYDNLCEVKIPNDKFDIYKVSEKLKTEIVLSKAINLNDIVNAHKAITTMVESLHSKLILRSSLTNCGLESNLNEIKEKINDLTKPLNIFNENLAIINSQLVEELIVTIGEKDNYEVVDLSKFYVNIPDAPCFIKTIIDVYEFKKETGIHLTTYEVLRALIKATLDYELKIDTISLNKMIHAIAIDDLKEYLEVILK